MKYVQLAVFIGSINGSLCAMNPNAMDDNMTAMAVLQRRAHAIEKALEQTKVPAFKAINEHMEKLPVQWEVKYKPEF
jgi:hypothetical protein